MGEKTANGDKFVVIEQEITHYYVKRFLKNRDVVKCITTTIRKY